MYSARALKKDVSDLTNSVHGMMSTEILKKEIEKRKREVVPLELEKAVLILNEYFKEIMDQIGPKAAEVMAKATFSGIMLEKEESELLNKALRKVRTTTKKSEATKLASFVAKETESWKD